MGFERADVAGRSVDGQSGDVPADVQRASGAAWRCGAGGKGGDHRRRRAADVDSVWRSNYEAEVASRPPASKRSCEKAHESPNGKVGDLSRHSLRRQAGAPPAIPQPEEAVK